MKTRSRAELLMMVAMTMIKKYKLDIIRKNDDIYTEIIRFEADEEGIDNLSVVELNYIKLTLNKSREIEATIRNHRGRNEDDVPNYSIWAIDNYGRLK